jgi:hypothetical protein
VCSLSLTTGSSIPVVVMSGTYTGVWPDMVFVPSGIGTLFMSNNGPVPVPYQTGDIIRVYAQDQASPLTITVSANWDGAVFTSTTSPDGLQNWTELPTLP